MILDKTSYISAIEEILNDHKKLDDLDIPVGKEFKYITNLEKRITSDLKLLKNEETIDKATYNNIKPVGSRSDILCSLGKKHKETKNGLLHFRPILSATGYTYLQTGKILTIVFDTFN